MLDINCNKDKLMLTVHELSNINVEKLSYCILDNCNII